MSRSIKPTPPATEQHAPPAEEQPNNPAHEAIRAELARVGVTHDDQIDAVLSAHDGGLDVWQVLQDVKHGVPQWIALLCAVHEQELKKAGKGYHKPAKEE